MMEDIFSWDTVVFSFTKRRKGGVSEISVSMETVFLLCDLRLPKLGFWIVGFIALGVDIERCAMAGLSAIHLFSRRDTLGCFP